MEHLFVYGTLAPGQPNEDKLAHLSGSWEAASVRGRVIDLGWGSAAGYPGILLDDSADEVNGFFFSSSELRDAWAVLDDFEGSEYLRVLTTVRLRSGAEQQAYIYRLNID